MPNRRPITSYLYATTTTTTIVVILLANTLLLLPVTAQTTTASNITTSIKYECTEYSLRRERPLISNCYTALSNLPSTTKNGRFHDDITIYDDYQLPIWQTHNTCEIKVGLVDHFKPEVSSWRDVGDAVDVLVQLCVGAAMIEQRRHTGGWVRVGPHQGIEVSLTNPRYAGGGGDVGNVQITSS